MKKIDIQIRLIDVRSYYACYQVRVSTDLDLANVLNVTIKVSPYDFKICKIVSTSQIIIQREPWYKRLRNRMFKKRNSRW